MELHLFLVVAQPWQGPGLPCTISALALPYLMLPVKDPRHYSMDMLWQCPEDLKACRFAVLAAPESKSCWQAGLKNYSPTSQNFPAMSCTRMLTSACSLLADRLPTCASMWPPLLRSRLMEQSPLP